VLDRLTVDTFTPVVGERLTLDADGSVPLELELVTAEPVAAPPLADGGRTPFRLLFRGPRDPVLPQRIYPLTHHSLGTLEVFIVPIGRNEVGTDYEAIFA
jgi:hypothetical protein